METEQTMGIRGVSEGLTGTIVPVLDLRDYFAAAALTGLLANRKRDPFPDDSLPTPEEWSLIAYVYADAMLRARGGK